MDMKKNSKKNMLFLLLIIIIIILYLGSFRWLLISWLTMDSYNHGFLIPIVSIFLIWRKRGSLFEDKGNKNPFLFIFSLIIYLLGQITGSIFITTISLIPFILGLIQFFRGTKQAKDLAFPIIFLIFAIPLPNLEGILFYLQSISTILATNIAHLLGVSCSYEGCQIFMNGTIFAIAPECSGFNSIISFYTLVTLLVYLISDPFKDKIILLIAAFPIALFTNALRIAITLLIASNYGVEQGIRYFHDWGGITFYLMAIILIFILLRCIRWMRKISIKQ